MRRERESLKVWRGEVWSKVLSKRLSTAQPPPNPTTPSPHTRNTIQKSSRGDAKIPSPLAVALKWPEHSAGTSGYTTHLSGLHLAGLPTRPMATMGPRTILCIVAGCQCSESPPVHARVPIVCPFPFDGG